MNRLVRSTIIGFMSMILVLSAIISVPLLSQRVYANTYATDSFKKALLSGLKTCYNDTYMKKEIIGVDFYGTSSLVTSKLIGDDGENRDVIKVPNKVGNNISGASISCKQLFDNLNSQFNKKPTLSDLGYHLGTGNNSEIGSSKNCAWYEYSYNESGITTTGRTERVCFQVIDNEVETTSDFTVEVESAANTGYGGKRGPISLDWLNGSYTFRLYFNGSTYQDIVVGGNPSWDEMLKKLGKYKDTINTYQECETNYCDSYYRPYNDTSVQSSIGGGEVYETYYRDKDMGALEALRFYTGDPNATWISNAVSFTSMDIYTMYSSYFNQAVAAHPNVLARVPDSQCTVENTYEYALYNNGKWCKVTGVENINENYNGVDISGDYWTGPLKPKPFSEIVKTLGKLNYQYIESQGGVVDGLDGIIIDNGNSGTTDPDGSSGNTVSTITACYQNAGALGWIACPVLEVVGNMVQRLYGFIESSLEVGSSLVSADGVRSGWNIFRNIANTVFVILFIIVILSQLTGIGISNYSIKKILPRLIMVAILVNISLIICQIAVDISNILGSELHSMFVRFSQTAAGTDGVPFDLGTVVSGMIGSLFTVGATAAIVAVFAITIPWDL